MSADPPSLRDNPYAAPSSVEPRPAPGRDELRIFLRWERLRVVYNLTLVGVVLIVVFFSSSPRATFADRSIWGLLIPCALGANLGFCAGPVAEGYARWIGFRHPIVTVALFVVGTGLSALMAAVVIIYHIHPEFE